VNCCYSIPSISEAGTYSPRGTFTGTAVIEVEGEKPTNTLKFNYGIEPDESVTGGIVITVVIEPELRTEELPVWFLNEYSDAIISGAEWKLYSMPDQPWTSPRNAGPAERKFESAITDAAIDGLLENEHGGETMECPFIV